MPIVVHLDPQQTEEERLKDLFAGHLLLYSARPSVLALCEHAKAMIREALDSDDPERAQSNMEVEEFVQRVGPLKSRFTNDATTKALVQAILTDFGCDLKETYFDVPRLRVVTSDGYLTAGVGYAYKPHRDTWYSSPDSQINWWSAVYSLSSNRSLAFYPRFWEKPVDNTSSDFDYDEWCRVGRTMATSQIKTDTRNHPLPCDPIGADEQMRVPCSSGGMILFSGAHLHETVPNNSGLTRFSMDFRTVSSRDLEAGRGAPNIDNGATGTTLRDFLRADDFSPIAEALVELGTRRRA